jgi:photosystem II stability/assembly factor-like uncharacterized protein
MAVTAHENQRMAISRWHPPRGGHAAGPQVALVALALVASAVTAFTPGGGRLPDVLDMPPLARADATRAIVSGIAASGQTLIAVGPRGTVLRSTDNGAHWQMASVPVSADLTSVRFSSPETVWAVGHDAVILKSADAGATWSRVLDGRILLETLRQAAQRDARLAKEVERTMAQSADPDVWPTALFDLMFVDDRHGFAVGAFGLLLATTDGGQTWQPAWDRADNERGFHLYAIRGDGGRIYIAGEQGVLLRWDDKAQRFVRLQTPYEGSYFGLATAGDTVLIHGLRGNAFLSLDAGATWRKLVTGTEANLVSAELRDGAMWLATQSGDILGGAMVSDTLAIWASAPGPDLYGAVEIGPKRFAVARLSGVSTIETERTPNDLRPGAVPAQ